MIATRVAEENRRKTVTDVAIGRDIDVHIRWLNNRIKTLDKQIGSRWPPTSNGRPRINCSKASPASVM
ncbi:MAG: hypothetical protein U0798_05500 [Gemmataceae bacterium]